MQWLSDHHRLSVIGVKDKIYKGIPPLMSNFQDKLAFIWSIAELLRGDFRQSDYGKVILPFTVLRRLDCLLDNTKEQVLQKASNLPAGVDAQMREAMLNKVAGGYGFHNISPFTFAKLKDDPNGIGSNLHNYIAGFSESAREIFLDKYEIDKIIDKLDKAKLLYLVFCRFADIDLHPDTVKNTEMGNIFEELIRRFSEDDTAGEHFTPREVIKLMVNLLFQDDAGLATKGIIRTLFDPTAGTGGMLSTASEHMAEINPDAQLEVYGQELNPESYAICKSDMLIKGQDISHIAFGNSFTEDGMPDMQFDYFLSNPPFGVEWKKIEKFIKDEHSQRGFNGRFGAGLPRVSDGSLMFLQHMISKFKPTGSRLAIVLNGSPLFTGSAGSGESEIRRWIIENDWLEAIVALPDQLFYNTGITTYIWIVTNNKSEERRGKIQLVNATGFSQKMRKSLGNKRNFITDEQIAEITRLYGEFEPNENSKIFDNRDFGYWRVTVERPLMENGKPVKDKKGNLKPDADLRDSENIPLKEDIEAYFKREVLPHVPDAWIDHDKTKTGYEIPFTRHFYQYTPPRQLEIIAEEIEQLESDILGMLKLVMA